MELLGSDNYLTHPEELAMLNGFVTDSEVLRRVNAIKHENKERFARFAFRNDSFALDTDSIMDVQIKRLHEYKRQLLCAMSITSLQQQLHDDPNMEFVPRTFVFGAKAAAGYRTAKRIIELLLSLADDINNDPVCHEKLHVYFVENRRVILAAQAAACLMWIVHYGLLGAMTAATINILSFARSVVFYFNDRKWAKSRAWLWAFLALYVVNTVLTWDGPRSLLPGIAMSMTTIALWTRDMRRTRLLYLTNSPFWFTYDILARSYSCMVIEAIAFVSYVVAVWRFDIKKQPQT